MTRPERRAPFHEQGTDRGDLRRWATRVELANAIFDHLEIFHKRQHRRSALDLLTALELRNRQLHVVS